MDKCKFIGSYVNDAVTADTDVVEVIRAAELAKYPASYLKTEKLCIRKLAIDAPAGAEFTINGVEFKMPTTGLFEIGLDVIDIRSLTFKTSCAVNIVYFYG